MRCGRLGVLQWLHACSAGALSFQCVRRLRPRVLECRRLGTAIEAFLPVGARAPSTEFDPEVASTRTVVELRATARAQPGAILATPRRHRQLEQERFARILAQMQPAAVVEFHVIVALELFLDPLPRTAGTFGEDLERHTQRALEPLEAPNTLEPSCGSNRAANVDPVPVALDPDYANHAPWPFLGRQTDLCRIGLELDVIGSLGQVGEI
jgi:hypothetical protein